VPSDQAVTAKIVLQTLAEYERRGATHAMQTLEAVEPELTDHVLNQLTNIHQEILNLGGPPKKSQRAYRSVQALVLVALAALRRGHYETWRQANGETRLNQLDPSLAPDARRADEVPPT
jgi:hypothetical protein